MYVTILGSSGAFLVIKSSYEGVFPRSLHFYSWYNDWGGRIQSPEKTCSLRVSPHSIVNLIGQDAGRKL